jgi:hypothetical protein
VLFNDLFGLAQRNWPHLGRADIGLAKLDWGILTRLMGSCSGKRLRGGPSRRSR